MVDLAVAWLAFYQAHCSSGASASRLEKSHWHGQSGSEAMELKSGYLQDGPLRSLVLSQTVPNPTIRES